MRFQILNTQLDLRILILDLVVKRDISFTESPIGRVFVFGNLANSSWAVHNGQTLIGKKLNNRASSNAVLLQYEDNTSYFGISFETLSFAGMYYYTDSTIYILRKKELVSVVTSANVWKEDDISELRRRFYGGVFDF